MQKTYYFFIAAIMLFSSCIKEQSNNNNLPYEEKLDEIYGTDSLQTLDVYLPENRTTATKVWVMVHGGSWKEGDKKDLNFLLARIKNTMPEAAIVNINYRLASSSGNHHPTQSNDIVAALDYVKSKKNDWQISDQFYMMGFSAGGHLCMLHAYEFDPNNNVKAVCSVFGPSNIYDWSWYSQALIKPILENYMGTTWSSDTLTYWNASPIRLVDSTDAPTILFHGNLDVVVPLYQSQWMHGKLNEIGVASEYYEYILQGHGFSDDKYTDCINKTASFFKKF